MTRASMCKACIALFRGNIADAGGKPSQVKRWTACSEHHNGETVDMTAVLKAALPDPYESKERPS